MQEAVPTFRPTWLHEPLYTFLFTHLPFWRTKTGILDIPRLSAYLDLSEEAMYKWFRKGTLPVKRARQLHELAVEERNRELLCESVDSSPELPDFYKFVD